MEEFAQGSTVPAPEAPIKAGDNFVEELFITTINSEQIDLRNFMIQMTLYEDVFSNVMSGTLIIVDALGFINKAPLVGGEFLSIQARTPGFEKQPNQMIRKTFVVYGISDRMFYNDRQQFYTIHFVSLEGFQDNISLISKGFNGSTDKIVQDVYSRYLESPRWFNQGNFTNEKTDLVISGAPHASTLRMVAPYWSPMKIINWVAARSLGKVNRGPSFLFFESNKAFYFTSLEDLIEEQRNSGILFEQYSYAQTPTRTESGNYTYRRPNIGQQYQIVNAMRFPQYIDLLKNQDNGYLAATMYTHDILLKQYKEWLWDYNTNFDTFQHLEHYTVNKNDIKSGKGHKTPFHTKVARSETSYRSLRTKQFKMFNDFNDPNYQSWVLQRNSLLCEASNIRLELDVNGRTDAEAGMLIYFNFPNGTDKSLNTTEPFDPLMSGLYLVTAIRHTFTPGQHDMRLEVIKDSFKQPVG